MFSEKRDLMFALPVWFQLFEKTPLSILHREFGRKGLILLEKGTDFREKGVYFC